MQIFFSLSAIKKQRGLTLVEVMVTVTILGILLGVAIPSFQGMIEKWRTKKIISALEHSIYLARTESIRLGGGVSITPIACSGQSEKKWKCGWSINAIRPENKVLRNIPMDSLFELSSNQQSISFDRRGYLNGGSVQFTIKGDKSSQVACFTSAVATDKGCS